MLNWKRSENIPFPSIWNTFQARDSDSDEIVNYRVQDLPEHRFVEAVNHLMDYLLVEEVLGAIKGLNECPEARAESREIWEECVKQKLSIACFKEGSDELVGLNILVAVHKSDVKSLPKTKLWGEVYEALQYVSKSVNIYEKFNTDVYMSSSGLSVLPKYRGRGIAQQLLAARVLLGKNVGLTCTSSVFTSPASQFPAIRVGFEEVYSCSSEEFKSKGMNFPGIKPVKLMTLKIL